MPSCVSSTSLSFSVNRAWETGLLPNLNRTSNGGTIPRISSINCPGRSNFCASSSANGAAKRSPNLGPRERRFYGELGFKEEKDEYLNFDTSPSDERIANGETGGGDGIGSVTGEEESVQVQGSGGDDLAREKVLEEINQKVTMKRGKQTVKRSNIVAKQVISIQSALSLGFVSQLWVDTTSWVVMVVEVRPNLLSGESERFLLEEICQVGDVVLVEDETVMENTVKMLGLETLVGYEVVTPARKTIGKVRGYTFNINSGIVESLELDSFGISIIPSSLVSTYALFVEDVLQVAADRVVVHEAAASRVQRLTKGWWNTQNMKTSADEYELYDLGKPVRSSAKDRKTQRGSSRQRFEPRRRTEESEDDWDIPMDFS